ncbi:hypothetical protein CCB81_09105 [Armatimonadetes bacterium Uphvl-Ar2]|nr:hypothetical protein CCB81_09105 [Armatimonadetes bacterium Uphvl-Ar2]
MLHDERAGFGNGHQKQAVIKVSTRLREGEFNLRQDQIAGKLAMLDLQQVGAGFSCSLCSSRRTPWMLSTLRAGRKVSWNWSRRTPANSNRTSTCVSVSSMSTRGPQPRWRARMGAPNPVSFMNRSRSTPT